MLTTQDQLQKISTVTGLAPDQIRSHEYELSVLRQQGLLVDIDISGLSMFERAAKLDEIGMQPGDIREKRLRPGRKSTLPVRTEIEELYSIATSVRSLLNKYSRKIPGFHPYAWISFTAFAEFKKRFTEYQERFYRVVEHLCLCVEGYRDQLAEISANEACQSWKAINGQGYTAVFIDGHVFSSVEQYVDAQVERDLASLPDAEQIRAQVRLDYVVGMLFTQVDIEAADVSAEILKEQLRAEKDANYMRESQEREAFRHQQALHQEREDRERELRERILHEEMEHVRQQLAEQGSPFDEMVKAMRVNAAESASEMLQAIKKSGFIHGKVAEKGRGLLEYFNLMATHDDRYLQDLLKALDEQLVKAPKERQVENITGLLEQIDALARKEVKTVLTSGGRFAAIEA
jgi:hypothetical protein